MGNVADRMEDHLWLGDKHTYEYPEYDARFKAIVTAMLPEEVTENCIAEKVAGRTWLHVPVDDDFRADISQYFLQVIQFIDENRKAGPVLVHCAAGISRSSTLVAAYLMWEHGWTRRQALEHLTARRKIVDPNDGFMDQLLEFERVLAQLGRYDEPPVEEKVCADNSRETV
jgi:protein-tyrosine phosphatase